MQSTEHSRLGTIGWQKKLGQGPSRWIESCSPAHGTDSTHGPAAFAALPHIDPDFPLTLVNHPSPYVYTEPWYYGTSHGMAI